MAIFSLHAIRYHICRTYVCLEFDNSTTIDYVIRHEYLSSVNLLHFLPIQKTQTSLRFYIGWEQPPATHSFYQEDILWAILVLLQSHSTLSKVLHKPLKQKRKKSYYLFIDPRNHILGDGLITHMAIWIRQTKPETLTIQSQFILPPGIYIMHVAKCGSKLGLSYMFVLHNTQHILCEICM